MGLPDVVRKVQKVRSDPSLLRYRVLGRLGRFPVGPVDTPFFVRLPVYCISLQRSRERRALLLRQFEAAGWPAPTFVDAVEAAGLDLPALAAAGDYDPVAAERHHGKGLSPSEIACSLSHGLVYKRVVRDGHARALVLEDDALLETRRLRAFDTAAVPADWDVLFLSSFVAHRPPLGHVEGTVYGTQSWHGSAAAYVVTADAARRLLAAHRPVQHAADGLLGRNLEALPGAPDTFRQQGAQTSLRSYLVWPDPIVNGSDVHFYATTLRPRSG